MKIYTAILIAIILAVLPAFASSRTGITDVRVRVNTTDENQIQINFYLSDEIDDYESSKLDSYRTNKAQLISLATDSVIAVCTTCVEVSKISISITFDIGSGEKRKRIINAISGKEGAYATIENDFMVIVKKEQDSLFVLTPGEAEARTRKILTLSEDQLNLLESAAGGNQGFYEQSLDITRQINEKDTASAHYVIDFSFGKSLGRLFGIPLGLSSKGRVSTENEGKLDRLEFVLEFLERRKPREYFKGNVFLNPVLDIVLISDQQIDTGLVSFRLGIEGLFPNFIDLSAGANRLRLKPYLKAGFGYIRHFQDQPLYADDNESIEFFTEGYYYIPVLQKFAIIAEVEGRFVNIRDKEKFENSTYHASTSLCYDLPLEDLKALITWETGRNEFSITNDTQLLIGILMNQISF